MLGGIADDMKIKRREERLSKSGDFTAIADAVTGEAKNRFGVNWTINYSIAQKPEEERVGYQEAADNFWRAVHAYAYRAAIAELADDAQRPKLEKDLKPLAELAADITTASNNLRGIFETEESYNHTLGNIITSGINPSLEPFINDKKHQR